MHLGEDAFKLRSVVMVETEKINTRGGKDETIITGCTTAVVKDDTDRDVGLLVLLRAQLQAEGRALVSKYGHLS